MSERPAADRSPTRPDPGAGRGAPKHVPVLPEAVLSLLAPRAGETLLDCTAGLGGHAATIGGMLGVRGTVVLFDVDAGNLAHAASHVGSIGDAPRVHTVHSSFVQAPRRMAELGFSADMMLADLGFASNQMADAARGFSFMNDGPLDMRLDPTSPITAAELVNSMPEKELGELLAEFGEEPSARAIARKLVQERSRTPIQTTLQFAAIVRAAVPARLRYGSGIDPATRSFQALRIAVNDELGSLAGLLAAIERAAKTVRAGGSSWLAPGARVGIISFHSLEDRPVKRGFASMVENGMAEHLTRKPTTADENEVARNPRARSAKLRVIRLCGGPDR